MTDSRSPADPPSDRDGRASELQRTYTQLLKLQAEIRTGLETIREQADAPAARQAAREAVRSGDPYGERAAERLRSLVQKIETALKAARASERELERELAEGGSGDGPLEDFPDLPARLARFIDERREDPAFHYEVIRDPLRGWTVRWKEYGPDGMIRGSGQFCEHPYSWPHEAD